MNTRLLRVGLALTALAFLCVAAGAAVPSVVSYQGRLTNAGAPVSDGNYSVVFTIYDALERGNTKWTETRTVSTKNGLFTVVLGTINPILDSVFSGPDRFMGLKVGSDPELTPRSRIASVPYAMVTSGGNGWIDDGTVVRLSTITDRVGIGTDSPKASLQVASSDSMAGYFTANGPSGYSGVVRGEYTGTANYSAIGVFGKAAPQDGFGVGGDFEGGYAGVQGKVTQSGNGPYFGLIGAVQNFGAGSCYGVAGEANYGTGSHYGVHGGVAGSGPGYAIYGNASSNQSHFAGYFTKGNPGAVNNQFYKPVAVFENSAAAFVAINSPDANTRGILFGSPISSIASAILYNKDIGLDLQTPGGLLRISDAGYVGIGVNTPAAGFHLKGAGFPASFGYFDTDATGQDAGLRFYEAGTAKAHVFHQASTNTLNLYGSGYSGISVNSAGSVGIGTTSPTSKLHVVGNICYTGSIGACSDSRYKTEVRTLTGTLDKVLQLRGVSYQWKKDEYPDKDFDDNTHIGFLAQELEQRFPELVMTDSAGYKSVDYGRLTPVLVEAIKAQQKEIKNQQEAIASQATIIGELRTRLEKLEALQARADTANR